jgi:hypothetical protein
MNDPQLQDQPAPVADKIINIENIDTFARLIMAWHHNRVRRLEHMLQVPDGTTVNLDEGEPRPLEGELKEGFLLGLHVALAEFGVLPFEAHQENAAGEAEPAKPAEAEASNV